jgi:hypothetical protein
MFYLAGNFFIPSIETLRLQDPFEGQFHFDVARFKTVMREQYGERVAEIEAWIQRELCSSSEKLDIGRNRTHPNFAAGIVKQRYIEFLRKTRFASCWFLSDNESAAMWNNYGRQGVAISTTVKKLSQLLSQTERDFEFGRMRYVRLIGGEAQDDGFDPDKREDAQFLLKPHFLKRKEYESEKEVRFVTASPGRGHKGIVLETPAAEWIGEIRLWPGLKPVEEESIKRVVAHFAIDVACACSDLLRADQMSSDTVASVESQVDDLDWNWWKNGRDGIPTALKGL